MTFFTILWIIVQSPAAIEGSTTGLVYTSLAECEAAIKPVTDTLPYDYTVYCEETATMSRVVRPKPRPEGLGE